MDKEKVMNTAVYLSNMFDLMSMKNGKGKFESGDILIKTKDYELVYLDHKHYTINLYVFVFGEYYIYFEENMKYTIKKVHEVDKAIESGLSIEKVIEKCFPAHHYSLTQQVNKKENINTSETNEENVFDEIDKLVDDLKNYD